MKKVIVIGGGISGASAAYQLTKLSADVKVTIIDRKDPGQATDAAAGIICPWLSQRRNKAWYQLAKKGARFYSQLIAGLEKDGEKQTGYKKVGALRIHTDAKRLAKVEERAEKRRQDAPEMGKLTPLPPQKTRERFPPLASHFSSLHVEGAARVDGRALRDSLLRASQKNGASFIRGSASLLHQGKKVTGVRVNDKEVIPADIVIVCAGAWAKSLLAPLGVNFLGTFQKGQIVHLQLPDTPTNHWPVIMPPNDQYMLTLEDHRIIVGATHENDLDHFDTRVTAGGLFEVIQKALDVAPGLEHSTLLETRVGFRPYTPGFLPIIGPLPGWDGILLANGLGASGLTMGPFIGNQLAKLALGLELDIDLSLYDVKGALEP
jgi:D-amino-acid dehydrogenase